MPDSAEDAGKRGGRTEDQPWPSRRAQGWRPWSLRSDSPVTLTRLGGIDGHRLLRRGTGEQLRCGGIGLPSESLAGASTHRADSVRAGRNRRPSPAVIPAAEVFLRKTESPKALTEAALWAIEPRPKTGVCVGFGKPYIPKTRLAPLWAAWCMSLLEYI